MFDDIKEVIRLNDNGQNYKQWSIKVLNRKLNIEQHESWGELRCTGRV